MSANSGLPSAAADLFRDIRGWLQGELDNQIDNYSSAFDSDDRAVKRRGVDHNDCGDIPDLEEMVGRIDAWIGPAA